MEENKKYDQIEDVEISKEMQEAFLDYSMSVIVQRALPDVRDGMKPVHRRILHAMNQLNITSSVAHKKSARIVGEVIGKYHPHGDTAVYDAMVRMAQDFSYRYPLVDGHGNFGSMDGDGAAAMRYTEARMSKISMEMMRDIQKETVNFEPNYDGEETEEENPVICPDKAEHGKIGKCHRDRYIQQCGIDECEFPEICLILHIEGIDHDDENRDESQHDKPSRKIESHVQECQHEKCHCCKHRQNLGKTVFVSHRHPEIFLHDAQHKHNHEATEKIFPEQESGNDCRNDKDAGQCSLYQILHVIHASCLPEASRHRYWLSARISSPGHRRI